MQLLEERIRKDGIVKPGNILKVDSFINNQKDITFFNETSPKYGIAKDGKLIVPCEYDDGCMKFRGGVTALKKD